MTDVEVFEYLFTPFEQSDDDCGVVAACLVRGGVIAPSAVSRMDGTHAEYALLQKLDAEGIAVEPTDVVYTTLEPCGKRTPGGRGGKMGDCTTNLIRAGVKRVIYAAADPAASAETRHKFADAGVALVQVESAELMQRAVMIFNASCADPSKRLAQ